jgi:DnaJ-class molecular chaperone
MNPKNYYQILQVDPSASAEVIEVAYHRLARMYHPDVNRDHDAIQRMQQLNEAYDVLCNPARRAQYDQSLHTRSVTGPQCEVAVRQRPLSRQPGVADGGQHVR